MKQILCIVLMGLLLAGCVQPSHGVENVEEAAWPMEESGYDEFVALLSSAVLDGTGNKNLSPVSVYLALAMAAEGARGETQSELLGLLKAGAAEDMRKTAEALLKGLDIKGETGALALADSLWMGDQDQKISFHKAYLDLLKGSYRAEARSVPFGSLAAGEKISKWIREKTREKVQPSPEAMTFDADTLAVLISAVYLKDAWREPFQEELTEPGEFFGPNGMAQAEYMRRLDTNVSIVRGEGFWRYALPLNEVGRMVFVLPDEGVALSDLVGSPAGVEKLLKEGQEQDADVDLMVPKFRFQDRTDLGKILMSLGARTCFTDGADFSGMTDVPAYISQVLQESYMGLDENGVEAAAYTLVAMTMNAALPVERERVDFHLTRPFLYAIESWDGTVLFIGTVTEPAAE